MAAYDLYLLGGQSNINRARSASGAPPDTYSSNVLIGCKVWNSTAIVDFNNTIIGPSGNGSTWVGVGSSSSGNYCWADLFLREEARRGRNVLICQVTEGGSRLNLSTHLNGSHNVDTATLTSTYPTTPRLHEALVNRYNALISFLGTNGDTYTVRAFLWDQGEGDIPYAKNRIADLTAKFAAIRTLTGNANLPIYYCTRPQREGGYLKYIEEADLTVAASNVNNKCLKLPNGTTADGVHFDDATMLHIAKYFIDITYSPVQGTVVIDVPANKKKIINIKEKSKIITGVTASHKLTAIDYYFTEMEAAGLLSKVKAVFLTTGENNAADQINWVNPYYRNDIISGAASSDLGLTFDGVNDVITSTINVQDDADMRISNFAIDVYSRTNSFADQTLFSWNQNGSGGTVGLARCFLTLANTFRLDIDTAAFALISPSLDNTRGLYTVQVRGGNAELYKNGATLNTKAYVANEYVSRPVSWGVDIPGGDVRYLGKQLSYRCVRLPYTPAEMITYSNIVQQTQIRFQREVNLAFDIPTYTQVLDRATALGATLPSVAYRNALETFMGNYGVQLSRTNSLFIGRNGGGADVFANINLARPVDGLLLSWPNGITYNSNGWTGNGTTFYGDTNMNPATEGRERYLAEYASRFLYAGAIGAATTLDGMTSATRNNMSATVSTVQRLNAGSNSLNSSADLTGVGFKAIIQTAVNDRILYNNSTRLVRTQTGGGILSGNQWILRQGITYGDSTIEMYGLGSGLEQDVIDIRDGYNILRAVF